MRLFLLVLIVGTALPVSFASASKARTQALGNAKTVPAAPSSCDLCAKSDAILKKLKTNEEAAVNEAASLFEKVQLSKDADLRKKEIDSVVSLAADIIPKNDEGQVDEYFFDLYQDHKDEIDTAIKSLPESKQKVLKESLEHQKKISESGNGY
jgi:hypothetical protein